MVPTLNLNCDTRIIIVAPFSRPASSIICSLFAYETANEVVAVISGGGGVQLVQKKKTIFPEWNSCFDAHLYEGRVIQMVVNHRPATKVAECHVTARSLADRCNNGELTNIWVSRSQSLNCLYTSLQACSTISGGFGL